jgi:dTDP-4-amino-4,6-dideoxy-D-galactose acyltransferase
VVRLIAQGLSPTHLIGLIKEARQVGYHLMYVINNPEHVLNAKAIVRAGAWLADLKLTFLMDLSAPTKVATQMPHMRSASKFTSQLESLAWQSGEFSRFLLDSHFVPRVFQNLYSEWLRNSLSGAITRRLLTWHEAKGIQRGLLTLGEKNGRVDIGLLAVDVFVRGQQAGQQIVASAAAQAYNLELSATPGCNATR